MYADVARMIRRLIQLWHLTEELHGVYTVVWVCYVWRMYMQNDCTHKMVATGKRPTSLKKKKKPSGDFKCTMPPWLCNSMWPQHTLQMFADHFGPRETIPWDTIKQELRLVQPQGELYPIQTIFSHHSQDQLLSQKHWYWRTQTCNLSHPKRAPYRLS